MNSMQAPEGDEMAEAAPDQPGRTLNRRERARYRILQGTAVLPSFVTILNALAGLAAIHFATKESLWTLSVVQMSNLRTAAWLIALAMVFDMLDGRLARMTRRTSDFGAQLDSLCDAVSFGVAPAVLTLRLVAPALMKVGELGYDWHLERAVWSVAAVYVACAVLRLARFNVETDADESAHMDFRGLPTPGAAAAVASLVLLCEGLTRLPYLADTWQSSAAFLLTISITSLVVTLGAALLMVSQFRYIHLVNHYVRGRRPMSYLVKLVVLGLALSYRPFVAAAVFTNVYALSGPVWALWRRFRPGGGDHEQ